MQIVRSTPSHLRKCEYGDFELIPDEGWSLSYMFIDHESGLLVATVSLIDRTKWIDNGYGGCIIPTKEYKIDLETLAILRPDEWKKYFNYEKVEIFSDDGKYKLISQRVFEPERNSDGYEEELYEVSTGKLLSRGSSIAFQKKKRENLLGSFIRGVKETEERKRNLEAKPSLEQFFTMRLHDLRDDDHILYYHDDKNVYQLTYVNGQFNLSRSGPLPADSGAWKLIKFDLLKTYPSVDEFWNDFAINSKWYVLYKPLNRNGLQSGKALLLAKHIITFFNEVRKKFDFTYREYDSINLWSTLVWSSEYRDTEIKQWCSNCGQEVLYQARYPKYICKECAAKDKFNKRGHLLEFSNVGFSGGLKITWKDSHGDMIGEDDTQSSWDCIIDGKLFYAQEAKFGGIVIQKKE